MKLKVYSYCIKMFASKTVGNTNTAFIFLCW